MYEWVQSIEENIAILNSIRRDVMELVSKIEKELDEIVIPVEVKDTTPFYANERKKLFLACKNGLIYVLVKYRDDQRMISITELNDEEAVALVYRLPDFLLYVNEKLKEAIEETKKAVEMAKELLQALR